MFRDKRRKRERAVVEMGMGLEEHDADVEEEKQDLRERRTSQQRVKRVLATSKHLEQLTKQTRQLAGEEEREEETHPDLRSGGGPLDAAKETLFTLKQRHAVLQEKLTSGPGKLAREQLQREVDFAVLRFPECELDGDAWNDDVVSMLWGRVQSEVNFGDNVQGVGSDAFSGVDPRFAYRVNGRTVLCEMSGRRIGIRFETGFAGETCESYYCALTKSSSDRLYVCEHTVPFFLPLRETEACLVSSPGLFINRLGGILRAYVSRRQQLNLLKSTRADQVGEVYNSLCYNLLGFCLELPEAKVGVALVYDEMLSELPSRCSVTAWPILSQFHMAARSRRGYRPGHGIPISQQLQAAEGALQHTHLHEAYDQIVADVQATLGAMSADILV